MRHVDTGKRDRLAEDRRACGAGDDADLRSADMNEIAMTNRLIGLNIQPDQQVARVLLAADQRLAADEIVSLGFQGAP